MARHSRDTNPQDEHDQPREQLVMQRTLTGLKTNICKPENISMGYPSHLYHSHQIVKVPFLFVDTCGGPESINSVLHIHDSLISPFLSVSEYLIYSESASGQRVKQTWAHRLQSSGYRRCSLIISLIYYARYFVLTCASEMIPVVLHVGIGILAARECETKPGIDLIRIGNNTITIIIVHFLDSTLFKLVSCCFVVQHSIDYKREYYACRNPA